MFSKILIANRGEIACRVVATARKLGVATVAVYSDADAQAKHVEMADQAVRIGPAPVAESYLKGDVIIQAALDTGAQAIHPGYGFLSENPDFVEQVQAAGLVFIGPPASAIKDMGLKDAAKALMEKANVPVVPGFHGNSQDPDKLANEASSIGYPVLIKARAGGGGKGMRLVERPGDFKTALEAAQREGQASFGDPHCLIEKYITHPRHIEIQVFADAQGNVVHLFERDCSLQRRHQKVIEEAPAPNMPQDVREAMGKAAVEAARAIGYQGAGTVEFIADGSNGLRADGFWFMEMNTRLQVEHPVTEAITGLDLVELQLRIAAGAPLPFTQEDLAINGHSFEARIYAEDPTRDFVPAVGRLDHLKFPDAENFCVARCRVDSGVRTGDDISPHYDPMIAKLITHGPDRASALAAMTRALEATEVAGLTTNIPFLTALTRHNGFATGQVDTGLIGRDLERLVAVKPISESVFALAALESLGLLTAPSSSDPWDQNNGFRSWGIAKHTTTLLADGVASELTVTLGAEIHVNDVTVSAQPRGDNNFDIEMNGLRSSLTLVRQSARITVIDKGRPCVFDVPDPLAGTSANAETSDTITSPMPGQVTQVFVKAGEAVSTGQQMLVVEAMKMEHALSAPRDGTVAELLAQPGDQVSDGMVLARLEPTDG